MIAGKQYQQLTFNPRRQAKAQKQPRQGLQIKLQSSQQSDLAQPKFASWQRQLKSGPSERYLLEKDRSYEFQTSNYSGRPRREESRRIEEDRTKQDIVQRVKKLQDMVLPLVERDHEDEELAEFGWQSKIERRLMRIQSSLDGVRKQWQIDMEKRIMQMEEQLEQKYLQLKLALQ